MDLLTYQGGSQTKKLFTTLVFISDTHIPYEDKKAIEVVLKFLKDFQPDYILLGGDLIDFYSISKFNKDPKRALETQDDLDKLYEFLKKIRDICPNSIILYFKGNHENRLRTYKWTKCPELAYLRCLTPEKLFRLAELDIQWIEKRWQYGKLWFMHGSKLSVHSGDSARKNRDDCGTNVVHGHSHRTGKSNLTNLGGNAGGWESGCLCDLNPEYIEGVANWQHGLTVVQDFGGKIFHTDNIDIVKHSFLFGQKLYTLNQKWEDEYNNYMSQLSGISG